MTELIPELKKEQCLHCPNRTSISHLLAIVASKEEYTFDCEGPVTVSRGSIVTQVVKIGEPLPDISTWSIRIGKASSPTLFSRIDLTEKVECGVDGIQANEKEVAYPHLNGELIYILDGKRHATFFQGSEAGFRAHGLTRAFSDIDRG